MNNSKIFFSKMGLQRSTPYPVDPVLAAGCLRTFQNYMVKAQGGGGQKNQVYFYFDCIP